MKNSMITKVLIGIVCTLLVVAGVIWFFVYRQYKDSEDNNPPISATVIEEVTGTETPADVVVEPTVKPSVELTPTEEPEEIFDDTRIGNPVGTALVKTELANQLGITKENYPRIDGSTSTFSLVQGLYWQMFAWSEDEQAFENDGGPIEPAKTVPSYKDLIKGNVDLIIVPDPSQEVKDLEKESGVELEYIRIGLEGLVFLTPKENPVDSVTLEEVNQIYVDRNIKNWSQLGGKDGEIIALCRNDDSGSQAQFDNLVIAEGKEINSEIKEKYSIDEMQAMLGAVSGNDPIFIDGKPVVGGNDFTLGYSIYYFMQMNEGNGDVDKIKMLSVDGIVPSQEAIESKEYPLSVSYFAVIRKAAPKDSPERKIANWLKTREGQDLVEWAGLGKM